VTLTFPAPTRLFSSGADSSFDDARWDELVMAAGGDPLQSRAWGDFKTRHGWTVERVTVEADWGGGLAQVLFRRRGPVSLGYVPRGPVLWGDRDRAFRELTKRIDRVSRRRLAICTIFEPAAPLGLVGSYRDYGYVRGPAPFQPARTVRVPLLPDAELLAQMDSKHRYNIRLAGRRGVTVRAGTTDGDLGHFFSLLRDTSDRNEFGIHGFDYYADALRLFGDDAHLLLAEIDGQIAAAGMAVRFGIQAAYLYGASSSTVRADGAAFLLQYELMRWARDRGATTYDLWGIPSEDPAPLPPGATGMTQSRGEDHRGLYTFKTRFGGEIVRFPWPMERRYVPIAAAAARRAGVLVG
jgi:lipid II:glycine glycyltransferase (peptidoglycan interpeptide bridge formation enzyme)